MRLLCQYVNFFRKLRVCPLREVRLLASVVGRDGGSVTGNNQEELEIELNMDPWTVPAGRFKSAIQGYKVPAQDNWRISFLERLLAQRREMITCGEEVETVTELIDSLCSS